MRTRANIDADAPYRTSLTAEVVARDPSFTSIAWSKRIDLVNINDNLPVAGPITPAVSFTTTVAENSASEGRAFAQANASDADGNALTYSIISASAIRPAWSKIVGYNGIGMPIYDNYPASTVDISSVIGSSFAITNTGAIYSPSGLNYATLATAIQPYDQLDTLRVDPALMISLNVRVAETANPSRVSNVVRYDFSVADVISESQVYDGARDLMVDTIYYPNIRLRMPSITLGFADGYAFDHDLTYSWRSRRTRFIYNDLNNNGVREPYEVIVDSYQEDRYKTPIYGYQWKGLPWWSKLVKQLPPLVFDLNGDGSFFSDTTVSFDVDLDGRKDHVGWISAADGLLALDKDGNGLIDNATELSFMYDKPGATTDLEGLRAYDSNNDLVFDRRDARFGEFQIWQDANSNAITDAGELTTLAERGIASIDLRGWRNREEVPAEGNMVTLGGTSFTRTNGTRGQVGDIALRWTDDPNGATVTHSAATLAAVAAYQQAGLDAMAEADALAAAPDEANAAAPANSAAAPVIPPVVMPQVTPQAAPPAVSSKNTGFVRQEAVADDVPVTASVAATNTAPAAQPEAVSDRPSGRMAAAASTLPDITPPGANARGGADQYADRAMSTNRSAAAPSADAPADPVTPTAVDISAGRPVATTNPFADIAGLTDGRSRRRGTSTATLQQLIDQYDSRAATPGPTPIAAPSTDRDLLQLLDRMAAFHSGAGLTSAEQALARPADNSMIAQLAAAR